jgi:hypothetical protein
VPVAGVPLPDRLGCMRREAHRTPDHQIQVVEVRVVPSDLGEEDAVLVEDAQDAADDVDMAARLVKLADAEDARLQSGNIVHPGERVVLPVLAGEDDGSLALDVGDGAVAELDGAVDLSVELGKDLLETCHVVRGSGVEHPSPAILLLPRTEVGENLLLVDVDDAA